MQCCNAAAATVKFIRTGAGIIHVYNLRIDEGQKGGELGKGPHYDWCARRES